MEKVQAYKCDHCSMTSIYSSSVKRHERQCYKNPENHQCATCAFHSVELETVYNPYHGGDPGSTDYEVKFHYCAAVCDKVEQPVINCRNWKQKEVRNV